MKGESMKSKAVAVFAVAAICAWLARAGTIGPGFLIDADTAASVTGTIGGTAVAQVTNIAHAVTDPAAAAGSNYAWAVAGSAYQSATGAVPGIVSNMGLSAQSTILATNAFRMVPQNDPQGLTNWWCVDGTNEVHWSVAYVADTSTLIVTDAGGSNPNAWGRIEPVNNATNINGWIYYFFVPPVISDPGNNEAYLAPEENPSIPGVWRGSGPDIARGSVFVSYDVSVTTNVTTNATTAYVYAAVAGKASPLDTTNAALAVVQPYVAGATLGATALQPGATNGLASTNALASYLPLAGGTITGTLHFENTPGYNWWDLFQGTQGGPLYVRNANTSWRFTYPHGDVDVQSTTGDTSAMSGCPSGAASVGALAAVSNQVTSVTVTATKLSARTWHAFGAALNQNEIISAGPLGGGNGNGGSQRSGDIQSVLYFLDDPATVPYALWALPCIPPGATGVVVRSISLPLNPLCNISFSVPTNITVDGTIQGTLETKTILTPALPAGCLGTNFVSFAVPVNAQAGPSIGLNSPGGNGIFLSLDWDWLP